MQHRHCVSLTVRFYRKSKNKMFTVCCLWEHKSAVVLNFSSASTVVVEDIRLVLDLRTFLLSCFWEDNNHKGSYGSVAPLVIDHCSSSSSSGGSSDSSILSSPAHAQRTRPLISSHKCALLYTSVSSLSYHTKGRKVEQLVWRVG